MSTDRHGPPADHPLALVLAGDRPAAVRWERALRDRARAQLLALADGSTAAARAAREAAMKLPNRRFTRL